MTDSETYLLVKKAIVCHPSYPDNKKTVFCAIYFFCHPTENIASSL